VRPTVVLFDIDGTLISTAGAGRRAIEETFARRYGRREAVTFPFDGMTDPAIVRQGLVALGVPEADLERESAATLEAYVEVLAEVTAAATNFRVHAGIEAALDLLAARPATATGLGTGNIEVGARIKLERVGLAHRFPFGGFGSDHILRAELVRAGAVRGAARLGVPLGRCRVVVVGDTPKDIAAARDIGAESIAVATGSYKVPALRAEGATHAFATLAEPGAAAALVGD
jgi:phosphoglycolate phosphatase-like HAD superfamily hydrolase